MEEWRERPAGAVRLVPRDEAGLSHFLKAVNIFSGFSVQTNFETDCWLDDSLITISLRS